MRRIAWINFAGRQMIECQSPDGLKVDIDTKNIFQFWWQSTITEAPPKAILLTKDHSSIFWITSDGLQSLGRSF